jgi:hypothetical protein
MDPWFLISSLSSTCSTVAFLVLPLVLLVLREKGTLKTPLWRIYLLYCLAGWLLINVSVQTYFASLDRLVESTPNPSDELLRKWSSDGAAQVFALFLGWAQAAVYFLMWLGAFKVWRMMVEDSERRR